MAIVVKWLTQLVVVQSFRGFDSHRSPHIENKLRKGVFLHLHLPV